MITDKIAALELNRERIISDRKTIALRELIHTKKVIDDLYPTIAGAIGENLVEKELRKLSDKNILFNDFLLHSESGSIQIDHLLLNNAGIFLIETKNWSKESVENYELRSPVSQIKRSSRTLFSILNNETANRKLGIKIHHWGEIQIPIRSIIVMINNKPAETFKYVKVKTLDELNGYLNYFDPIFSDDEVQCIADYLNKINRNFTFPKNQQAAQYLSEVY
ncbi:MAG: nuclease-related domain-containing protein [Cyclobacteriaceae bacterium]